jgi:hypothetical protein
MDFADLKGTWALSESFAHSVPESCRDLTIEVSDRSLRTYSGKQVITAECQIGQRHDDFVVLVSAVHVNDEVGCDGATPDEVRRRYKMLQIWRPDGAGLKVLAPITILELVKVKAPDTSEKGVR